MALVILIIDDDEAVRFFHRIIVTQSGLSTEPLCFSNGVEALAYLDKNYNSSNYYLVLLDINMPVMDGWDMLYALDNKNYYSQVNVVMVTSSVNKTDLERAKEFKTVIDFVEKPISDEAYKKVMDFFSAVQSL